MSDTMEVEEGVVPHRAAQPKASFEHGDADPEDAAGPSHARGRACFETSTRCTLSTRNRTIPSTDEIQVSIFCRVSRVAGVSSARLNAHRASSPPARTSRAALPA